MARLALIDGDSRVANIVVGEPADFPSAVPAGNARLGDMWDGFVFSAQDPIAAATLPEAREILKAAVKSARDVAIRGGYAWDRGDGTQLVFQTDDVSQARLNAAVTSILVGTFPAEGMLWRLADNSTAVLSDTELQDVATGVMAHVAGAFAIQAQKEAEIDALTDTAAAQAYDPQAGFPAVPEASS